MKFKYVGEDNSFCLELVAFRIKGEHGDYLFKGDIITVPDDNERVIKALRRSPSFEVFDEPKKAVKKQKEDKK